jgi:hypothetical protein
MKTRNEETQERPQIPKFQYFNIQDPTQPISKKFFHNLSVHLKVFLYSEFPIINIDTVHFLINIYFPGTAHLFNFNFEIIIETIISAECFMFILSARLRAKKNISRLSTLNIQIGRQH